MSRRGFFAGFFEFFLLLKANLTFYPICKNEFDKNIEPHSVFYSFLLPVFPGFLFPGKYCIIDKSLSDSTQKLFLLLTLTVAVLLPENQANA